MLWVGPDHENAWKPDPPDQLPTVAGRRAGHMRAAGHGGATMNADREGGVVVHLDEEGADKYRAVLRNVGNLLADLGDQARVELVAHGPGIGLCLADSSLAEDLHDLIGRGVVVAACENTLEMKGIARERLAAGVVTVPSGMGELVRKQQKGWAYVRP